MRSFKISVYITSYNQKEYLVEAIESVLNQTLQPYEIIIVDDYSTDGSQKIIADYALRYPDLIKPVYHDQNMGIARTRNTALKAVKGDYVTFVDGDDRFLPTKLEKECELLQTNPRADIVFSNYYSMSEDGKYLWLWIEGNAFPPQGNIFRETFAIDFPKNIHFRNELINFKAWKHIGFYDPKLTIYEDYELRIRLTKKLRAYYNNKPSIEYRRHSTGLSSSNLTEHLKSFRYIYRKNKHLMDDLNSKDKKLIYRSIIIRMAKLLRSGAIRAIDQERGSVGSRMLAFRYFLMSLKYPSNVLIVKSIMRIIMPYKIYKWLERS